MWNVIRELPGKPPELVYQTVGYDAASAMVFKVAEANAAYKGAKVYLQKTDTADQLQVTQKGLIVPTSPTCPPTVRT